jgi:Ca-activated chloride channel family protein
VSFQNPLLLLTLLVVPAAVAAYFLAERRRMRYAVRFTNLDVLAAVVAGRAWRRFVPLALFLLALAALCVGVARPMHKTLVPRDRATVILVVDVSRSMEASDVKPTRLRAAEAAIRTFLSRVPKRLRVGLIAFAGDPQVATPPTTERGTIREALQTLEWFPRYGGTAIGDALAAAVEVGRQAIARGGGDLAATTSTPTHGLVSILLLSDGAQTRGDLQPEEGAQRAKAAGIPVYTIALGTPNGRLRFDRAFGGSPPGLSPNQGGGGGGGGGFGGGFGPRRGSVPVPPDPATLRGIATTTGGRFFAARNAESLRAAYTKLGSRLGRKPGESEVTYAFLAAAAALLVAAGILSAAWSPRLP